MRRRLVHFLMGGLVLVVAGVALSPWWLGAALSLAGPRYGLSFDRYERIGFSRFALRGAVFRAGRTEVSADIVGTDTPIVWLWRRATGSPAEVTVGTWSVTVAEAPASSPPSTGPVAEPPRRGWLPLRATLQRVAERLDRWLPRARSGAGVVAWPGGGLKLASAEWSLRTLQVRQLVYRGAVVDGSLHVPAYTDQFRLLLRDPENNFGARLQSAGAQITGDVSIWRQPLRLQADFAEQGWWPRQALVQADDWVLPGERLKLGTLLKEARGRFRVEWSGPQFTAELTARGEPVADQAEVPALDAAVRAHGDFTSVTVDFLNLAAPGVSARLSEPVTVARDGTVREGAARFEFSLDLSAQPWWQATGRVTGDARLIPGGPAGAAVSFAVRGEQLSIGEWRVGSALAQGTWEAPRLLLEIFNLTGPNRERLEGRGGWDFRTREIVAAEIRGTLGPSILARWMPRSVSFDGLAIEARASGPLAAVVHDGRIAATRLVASTLKPVDANVTWQGRGVEISAFDLHVLADRTELAAAGSGSPRGARLTRLEFLPQGSEVLHLTAPADVRWSPSLQIDSLRLGGPAASLDLALTWGPSGRIEVASRGVSSSWWRDFVSLPEVSWELKLLALSGAWDRAPMTFTASATGEVAVGKDHPVSIMAAVRGGLDGVTVEALRATESGETVLNATGVLPLTLRPADRPQVEINPNGRVEFRASAAPHAGFWSKLAAFSGVELQEPDAALDVSGTWARPEGRLRLRAARVAVDPARFQRPWPRLDGLDLEVVADGGGAKLDHLVVRVEDQPVRVTGTFSVPADGWPAVRRAPLALARTGSEFQLELPSTDVAAFGRFLPAFVAPTGTLDLKINYRRGEFDGYVRLRDAASRPLGPLGVLQEVAADARLQGRRFVLREVTAKSGGQPVKLTGAIEIPENGAPRYNLALQGENLPFARQAGLLLRGDVDLKLRSPAAGDPKLTGAVRLRDSLFLADVRSFVSNGTQTAARRPPYFSISNPVMANWPIDVDVTGRRFLRVRTPVFTGVASANFRLGGTLGEPRAIGDVKLDEGHVIMPFASFELQQGVVRLTEANPYEPTLFVRGTGRRFGYNLKLEVDGSAGSPNVALSSSPALDSEQVLLMVMTGAPPTDEINVSATQRVTRIGTFLGQSLLGSLGGNATSGDRLSIASGEKISRQGKETYEIEYKLSDQLTLVGEYNEFDEQNAGLKWRIFPRQRNPQEGESEAK
jgi:translocation and assembly module TamB